MPLPAEREVGDVMALQIDDFSSGPYSFTSLKGDDHVEQTQFGTMAGGSRLIKLFTGEGSNRRHQPFHIDISTEGAPTGGLILTVGAKSTVHLGLHYGFGGGGTAKPLNIDVSSFTRCVVDFDWLLYTMKVNIVYWSRDGKRTAVGADVGTPATHPFKFALDLRNILPEHNQANPKEVTRFFMGFDTISGFAIDSIGFA